EHASGDQEAAEDVDRGQCHGQYAHEACQPAFGERGRQHGPHDDNGRDGVGDRHERRVQGRGDVPDDVIAHVNGEHENDEVDQGWIDRVHYALLVSLPSAQTWQAVMISSSCCRASSPSALLTSFMKSSRLRAYSAEASAGTSAGKLLRPTSVTPCFSPTLSSSDSGQLPPRSTAKSTMTEPARMPFTVSSLTSTGAGRPGMSAVVMTTSACLQRCDTSSAWRAIQAGGMGRA